MFATSEYYFQLPKTRIQEEDWGNNKDSLQPPLHTNKRKPWLILHRHLFLFIFTVQFKVRETKTKEAESKDCTVNKARKGNSENILK